MKKLLVLGLLLSGCVNAPQETATTGTTHASHTGPVRIGFSMDTLKEERWQRDKQLVEQRAREVLLQNGSDGLEAGHVSTQNEHMVLRCR